MPGLLRNASRVGWLLAAVALLYVLHLSLHRRQALIDIRFAHFSRFATTDHLWRAQPSQLLREGFLTDTPAVRAKFAEWAWREVPWLHDLPDNISDLPTIERAKAITFAMSGGGSCSEFLHTATLSEKLKQIPEGIGLCSDHTECFLAIAPMFDIFAVEISVTSHTILSIWRPETASWVMFDPQSCLIARDQTGQYLSPMEVRRLELAGQHVDWEFFGQPSKHFTCVTPQSLGNFDSHEDFTEAVLTMGNNVIEADRHRNSLRWMPRPLRQPIFLLAGIMPGYALLEDDHTEKPALYRKIWRRNVTYAGTTLLLLLLSPAGSAASRLLRRRTPSDDVASPIAIMQSELKEMSRTA